MDTDDAIPEGEPADELADERSPDGFDKEIDVEVDQAPPGNRAQKLDAPDLADPGSRADPRKVSADQAIKDAENEDRRKLRKKIIYPVLLGAAGQFVIADAVFLIYGFYRDWDVPSVVMTSWLSATVVQIVGVVLIVMKYLFPDDR